MIPTFSGSSRGCARSCRSTASTFRTPWHGRCAGGASRSPAMPPSARSWTPAPPRARMAKAAGSATASRRATKRSTRSDTRIRSSAGRRTKASACWWAGSTASASTGRSAARACSHAGPTLRKSRWPGLSPPCARAVRSCWTASSSPRTWPRSARSRSSRTITWNCSSRLRRPARPPPPQASAGLRGPPQSAMRQAPGEPPRCRCPKLSARSWQKRSPAGSLPRPGSSSRTS